MLKSKPFWALALPVALVAVYALVGFHVAPGIVREQAQKFVRDTYSRELAMGEVRIHPFKLRVDIRELALPDADGQPMLGLERLFIDLEMASLWNRAFTFREVTLESPRVRAVIRPDGALNLADLAPPAATNATPAPHEPLPSVWIQKLDVGRGLIDFVDKARRKPFEQQFRDVGFELADFRTSPQGGDFHFSARGADDATFDWKGRFALEPVIASQGEFKVGALRTPGLLAFLGDALPFTSTTGTISAAGTYRIALAEDFQLEVNLPTVDMRDTSLLARGAEAPWVQVPSFVVSGVKAAMPARAVTIARVAVDAPSAQAWLNPDGSVNLTSLFAAAEPNAAATDKAPPSVATAAAAISQPAAKERPWTVKVGDIELTDAAIDFEDRSIAPGTKFKITPVNLRVSETSLDLSQPLQMTLTAAINADTKVDVKGTLTPQPFAASLELRLAKARMTLLGPYVLPHADLTITAGELDVTGKVEVAPAGGKIPKVTFTGDVAIEGFKSVDNALKLDFLNIGKLQLGKLRYAMAPDSLSIDGIDIREPYARVIISPEQVVNIAAVLDPEGSAKALEQRRAAAQNPAAKSKAQATVHETTKPVEKATAPAEDTPADSLPIRIGEVRIDRMRMNFADNFIQPNFSADVQQLSGTIAKLSSAPDARATVDLKGKLGEFSPVTIKGQLQPFAFDRFTDMRLRFEDIQLPIFNPYSGSLAGYNITKGQLTTELHYRIRNRQLDAQHKIRVDQLEWGEATSTKSEATLPLKFATALLKDRKGVIDLDVPVGGTLDDPSFRIGPIVWQVLRNIITKAVAAPFDVLGSLFEGADAAQFVDFASGSSVLDPTAAGRLGALGKALVEKSQLKLDVPIGTVAELDTPILAERAYEAALADAVAARFGAKSGAAASAYASLEPGRKIEVLTALVTTKTGAAPKLPEPPTPPEGSSPDARKAARDAAAVGYLEQVARSTITVPEADLTALGQARALAIERALLASTGLDPGRVFTLRESNASASAGKVRLALALK